MISAALDIQGERAQQAVGESSTISVPGSRQINVPGTKTLTPVASQNPNKKKVLFVTSEIADLVKTGGLGDVSAALPRARYVDTAGAETLPPSHTHFTAAGTLEIGRRYAEALLSLESAK